MKLIGSWYGNYSEEEIKQDINRYFNIDVEKLHPGIKILEAEACEFPETLRYLCEDAKGIFEVEDFFQEEPTWETTYL